MKIDIDVITKILGAIGGLYIVIKETANAIGTLKRLKNTYSKRKVIFFAGNWNNQGQISNAPSHYIDLDSWTAGRKFTGRFNVRLGNDVNSWKMFDIIGKKKFGKIKCKIVENEGTKNNTIAHGLLKKKDVNLVWLLKEGDSNQFPTMALLRKGLPKVG